MTIGHRAGGWIELDALHERVPHLVLGKHRARHPIADRGEPLAILRARRRVIPRVENQLAVRVEVDVQRDSFALRRDRAARASPARKTRTRRGTPRTRLLRLDPAPPHATEKLRLRSTPWPIAAVLAPIAIGAPRVLIAVRIDDGHDPQRGAIDERADRRIACRNRAADDQRRTS